ncbi:MAG: phosphoglycerate mutase family [Gemmatimonadetes bacterium]|nr:phosphoglycerate mutase family [Gemmatimonadota bacterium]
MGVTVHLVLVRHGVASGVDGRCIGHTDVALSAAGAQAMRRLAHSWPELSDIGQPARIVASDLRRATESATIFAERWDLAIEYDARLRELDFGEWDGREWSALEAEDGARLRAWMDHWTDAKPPGGERLRELAARAAQWLDEARRHASAAETVVVVSHAGWIRAAVCHLFARPATELFDHPAAHARATIIRLDAGGPTLVASNAASISDL